MITKYLSKYWVMAAAMVVAMSTTAVSCSDDDDNEDPNPNEVDEEGERVKEEMIRKAIINALAEEQVLSDGTIRYVPRIGEKTNDVTPTVTYIGVDSLGEAIDLYRSSILSVASQDTEPFNPETYVASAKVDYEISVGNCHLKFQPGTTPDVTARLIIDCPELENVLTEVRFIPRTLWNTNDDASPFRFGSIWKNKETGRIYVCVRACESGHEGIMMTFDGGWNIHEYTAYQHHQGKFSLTENLASHDAWQAFADLLVHHRTVYEKACERLGVGHADSKTYKSMNAIKNRKDRVLITYVQIGSPSVGHHLWWFYNCWDITTYHLSVYSDIGCAWWKTYFTHESTPYDYTQYYTSSLTFSYGEDKSKWEAIYK